MFFSDIQFEDSPFLLAEELSPNLGKDEAGYLIAHNVKISRTGVYKYLRREVGLPGNPEEVVNVYRLPEDVFEPEAMSSFEGKAFTLQHPNKGVNIQNHDQLAKGHVSHIHRDGHYLVGNIVITNPSVSDKVESKQWRELSAGYDADLIPYKDGYKQVNIRGNHVALVEQGRAGHNVKIKDEKPRSTPKMSVKAEALKALATSMEGEALLKATRLLFSDEEAVPPIKTGSGKELTGESGETVLNGFIDRMDKMYDKMCDKFGMKRDKKTKDAKKKDEGEEGEESAMMDAISEKMDAMEKELEDLKKDKSHKDAKKKDEGEESEEKEFKAEMDDEGEEESEEKKEEVKDKIKDSFMALKPVIAQLPKKERKMLIDAMAKELGRTSNSKSYSKITQPKAQNSFGDSANNVIDVEQRKIGEEMRTNRFRKSIGSIQ